MIGSRLFFQRVATVICATWCLVGRESAGAVLLMPADSQPLQFARDEIERAVKDSGSKTPDVCLAIIHWQAYAETYAARYQQRVLYNRVGWVDRTALIENVRADVEITRHWKPGSRPGDRPKNPANPKAD